MKKQCIVTIKYDITDFLPGNWESRDDQYIREYIGDSPEILADADMVQGHDGYLVRRVDRK